MRKVSLPKIFKPSQVFSSLSTGNTSDKYETGYGGGLFVILPTSSASLDIVAGADYLNMPGKTITQTSIIDLPGYHSETTITTIYQDLQVVSIYAGPKFGKSDGIYFLPSVSLNIADEVRFGFYLGGGYLFPLESVKLHIGARWGILNLIGGDDKEDSESGLGIFAGIVF